MDRITEANTVGALLFGGLVASILYGITSMQTVTYYQRKREDKWFIRVAVPVLWILGTIDIVLIFHFLYYYLIRNYGNFNSVTAHLPVQTLNVHFFVIAITQSTVRSLCAVRIRALSQSWLPTLPIYLLTLVDLGSNLTLTVKGAHEQSAGIGRFGTAFNVIVCVEFAVSTAGDALVALCLCYLLRRSRTRVRSTESMINTIVAYLITTGLLTTMVQTSALVFFLVSSKNFIYLAVLTQVSKLYVNAYLALLNDRARIRDRSTMNPASVTPSRVQTAVSLVNLAQDTGTKSGRVSQSTAASSGTEAHFINKSSLSLRESEADIAYGHAV